MAKVLNTTYPNSYSLHLDYLIESQEFEAYKSRIMGELRKSVEIPGFRKGMVPADLADKELDPTKVQSIIYQETIEKYAPEAVKELDQIAKDANKKVLDVEATLTGEGLGNTDEGFVFRLTATTLPEINLVQAMNLKVDPADETSIKDRESLETTLTSRKQMLVDIVNKTPEGKDKPAEEQVLTFNEAMEKNPVFKEVYKDEENFEKSYTDLYNNETAQLIRQIYQQNVIQALLSAIPDFELPAGIVENETIRIVNSVEKESEEKKLSIEETFKTTGIPNPKSKKTTTKGDITAIVNEYVSNEIKLMWVLRYIYENEVTKKLIPEEVEELGKKMAKEPQVYGVPGGKTEQQYNDMAFDRLMRSRAFEVVESWVVAEKPAK